MKRSVMVGLSFLSAFAMAALFVQAQKQPLTPAAGSAERGKTYFQRDCAICHTVGHGKLIGPDLLGVTRRRTHRWLVTMIQHPGQLQSRRDPTALALQRKYSVQMPDLHVSDAECADLLAYFEAETAAHEHAAPANGPGENKNSPGANAASSPHP